MHIRPGEPGRIDIPVLAAGILRDAADGSDVAGEVLAKQLMRLTHAILGYSAAQAQLTEDEMSAVRRVTMPRLRKELSQARRNQSVGPVGGTGHVAAATPSSVAMQAALSKIKARLQGEERGCREGSGPASEK